MKSTEIRIGNFVDVINRSGYVHLPFNVIRKVGYIELFKVKLYEHDKPLNLWTLKKNTNLSALNGKRK